MLMLVVSISWSCWSERNSRVFRNKSKSTTSIASEGLQAFCDWSTLCKPEDLGEFAATWSLVKRANFQSIASASSDSTIRQLNLDYLGS